MSSLNRVMLIGNLGQDPDVRHSQDGKPIVNLSIATSESWKDKTTHERKERVNWHRVVIFNEPLAKIAEQYLKKGSKVYVEGALETRKYTDKDGAEKYATEVVMRQYNGSIVLLGDGGGGRRGPSEDDYGQTRDSRPAPQKAGGSGGRSHQRDLDDEVPF